MAFDYNILWTTESVNNLEAILGFLITSRTSRETGDFINRLSKQLSVIQQNPYLFPISQNNSRLRKAVLGKQITVFYEVAGQIVYLIHLCNNTQDNEEIK